MVKTKRRNVTAEPWFVIPFLCILSRLTAVVCHYVVPTPYGSYHIVGRSGAFFRALVLESAALLVILLVFRLAAHALGALFGARGAWVGISVYAAVSGVYLLYGQIDLELLRWLGQHVSLDWFRTYSWRPGPLTKKLFAADWAATSLALLLVIVPSLALIARANKARRATDGPRWTTTALLALLTAGGIQATLWSETPRDRWMRLRPPLWTFLGGLQEQLEPHGISTPALMEGIHHLHETLNRDAAYYPLPGYPIWHDTPNAAETFERFRKRPLAQKPDVLLVIIESPEAWEFDLRRPETRQSFPSLARLFTERGVFFPYCHSVGFPSPEGRIGIHLGLWSHPWELILPTYRETRLVSLPEVLASAGYTTYLLTAGDPEFDHMQPWYDRWYQRWDFRPDSADDLSAARRFVEATRRLPRNRPRFMTFGTVSMHAPQTLPGGVSSSDAPFHTRYLDACRFTDRALGEVLDAFRASPRWNNTIVVCVGDHSTPPPWIGFQAPRAGTPNAAETWIPLLVSVPGMSGGEVRTETVSQASVAQTILARLGLDVPNHFLGGDVLGTAPGDKPAAAVFSMRFQEIAMTSGALRFQVRLDDEHYMRKSRYADYDPGCRDGDVFGCYRNGTPLEATDEDFRTMTRVRMMARAYAELFERDRIMPPAASAFYPR